MEQEDIKKEIKETIKKLDIFSNSLIDQQYYKKRMDFTNTLDRLNGLISAFALNDLDIKDKYGNPLKYLDTVIVNNSFSDFNVISGFIARIDWHRAGLIFLTINCGGRDIEVIPSNCILSTSEQAKEFFRIVN